MAHGVDSADAKAIHAGLNELGAVARYVGARLGRVESEDGDTLDVDVTMETMPSVLFDAVVVPGGDGAAKALGRLGHAAEFIVSAYRHCKPILALGAGRQIVENVGVPATLSSGEPDPRACCCSTTRRHNVRCQRSSRPSRNIATTRGNGSAAGLTGGLSPAITTTSAIQEK